MALSAESIPGYTAGTWNIDAAHSQIGFTVRHLVSKVKGTFSDFTGTIVTAEDPTQTTVTVEVPVATIDTKQADRNGHLQSADFFDVEKFPTATFVSSSIDQVDGEFQVTGDLTLHGVTKQVTVPVEFGGIAKNPYGQTVIGVEATFTVNREDFGLTWNTTLETGGLLVGKDVTLHVEIEAALAE